MRWILLCALLWMQAVWAIDRHEAGRKIYNFRCYYCHGYSGDAKTLAATYLSPIPRDFTSPAARLLDRKRLIASIRNGRPGTAMAGFEKILKPAEIEFVADFVQKEFITNRAPNTRYHTLENGWPGHERYAAAYPFAKGEITLDTPVEKLTADQKSGRRLYLTSCVSCHDRAKVHNEGPVWEGRPLSYPRNQYSHQAPPKVDAITSASPYALHDRPPKIAGLTKEEIRGEKIYQANCAFCHAADGTGRNWIGSFLEPHPRDLTGTAMDTMTRSRLRNVIRDGLPGTSMPAWTSVLSENEIQALMAYISRAFHPVKE